MNEPGIIEIDPGDDLRSYPRPIIPTNPILSTCSFKGSKATTPSLLDVGNIRFLTSGRMAIASIMRLENIGPSDEVMIPAYHCGSMVTPVTWTGAKCVFYQINEDMSADLDDISSRTTPKTRILLIAHYFGFPQPLALIKKFCEQNRIILIEDCAHAFYGSSNNKPIGSQGDYAIGSLMKFFPVYDGGCLVSANNDINKFELESGGMLFELQAILNTIEKSTQYDRLALLRLLVSLPKCILKVFKPSEVSRKTSESKKRRTTSSPAASDGGIDFNAAWVNKSISRISRLVLSMTQTESIIDKRVKNYMIILEAFKNVPGCKPLFDTLPDRVVPYVFPLLVEIPDPAFRNLRRLALPILRWELLYKNPNSANCTLSAYYAKSLFQIPCHQELEITELARIIDGIKLQLACNQ